MNDETIRTIITRICIREGKDVEKHLALVAQRYDLDKTPSEDAGNDLLFQARLSSNVQYSEEE